MNLWRSFTQGRPTLHLRVLKHPICRTKRLASTSSNGYRVSRDLILPLKHKLTNDRHQRALELFHEYMQETRLDSESRFAAYVKTITLFMIHGHLMDACTVYARMQAEGYIPPRPIRATLAIMRTLAVERTEKTLLRSAAKAFYAESFNEEDFRTVLRIIYRQTRLSSSVYDALISLFLQSRNQEGYALSDKTKAWLSYIRTRRGPPGEVHQYPLVPVKDAPARELDAIREVEFAALRSMAEKDPEIAPVIHSALKRMEFSGGANDRIFYNVILSTMVDKMRYTEVFILYRMLMAGDTAILPDAFTFGALLRVLNILSMPRSARTRRIKKPVNIPSLRQLYRDMLYCHQEFMQNGSPSSAISGSLLNKIIHSFMSARDYAAAFVAIRTYRIIDLPITLATYRAVVGNLIERIDTELVDLRCSDDPKQYWSYRFLGCPTDIPHVDIRLVESILRSGGAPELQLEPLKTWTEKDVFKHAQALSAYMSAEQQTNKIDVTFRHVLHERNGKRGYRVPTGVTLLGLLDGPGDKFSATPLQRIARRALLAEHPRTFVAPGKVISMVIRHAKSEMLPGHAAKPLPSP